MADKRQHSRFGGSAAKVFLKCKAAPLFCETLPAEPPNPAMLEGTAAHAVIELCLNQGYDPQDMVGRFIDRVEISDDMAEAVTPFVEGARADMASGAKIWVEQTLSLAQYDAECWGTPDLVSYWRDDARLKVRDYKNGGRLVRAVENPQLLYYGLGAMLAVDGPVETVSLEIDQPNCTYAGDVRQPWEVDPLRLFDFGAELQDAVKEALTGEAPFTPGPHCADCKGRGACPAVYGKVLATTGTDLIPYTGEIQTAPVPAEPLGLSMDELGLRLNVLHEVESWVKRWGPGLRSYAHAEMLRGNIASGYKPVAKNTRRRFKDAGAFARLAPQSFPGEVTDDDMYARKVISPAAFERLVGKKAAAPFLAEHTEKPEALSLVPVTNKRAPVPLADLNEFEPIGDFGNGE